MQLMVEIWFTTRTAAPVCALERTEIDEDTLRTLRSLLGRVKFKGMPEDTKPLF